MTSTSDKPCLLYVEDEPDQDLTRILGKKGYEVISAQTGDEALEVFRRVERVDVILLDIMMPTGDRLKDEAGIEKGFRTGLVFLDKIKDRRIPVVVLSANPAEDVKEKAKKKGVYEFLAKGGSFNLLALIRTLNEALEQKKCQQTPSV